MQQLLLSTNNTDLKKIYIFTLFLLFSNLLFSSDFQIIEKYEDGHYTKYSINVNQLGEIIQLSRQTFDALGNEKSHSFDCSINVTKDGNLYTLIKTDSWKTEYAFIKLTKDGIKRTIWTSESSLSTDYSRESSINIENECFYFAENESYIKNDELLKFDGLYNTYTFQNEIIYAYTSMDFYEDWKIEYNIKDKNTVANIYTINLGNNSQLYCLHSVLHMDINSMWNDNMQTNIVNYEIIRSLVSSLEMVLFPLIFLENPFPKENHWEYNSNSFLKESNAVYSAQNLSTLEGLPWASGNGYGIGDIITIKLPVRSTEQLILYNGFQSKEKPYLYEQNSRVKKISITHKELNKKIEYIFNDSLEKQEIDISNFLDNYGTEATLQIQILEVYPGSKYKDLCIQAILPG